MYDEDVLEKKSDSVSFFGNLTMERVIKEENGQEKTGSLVFRIKRTLSKTNDDSGIKCSSPSSDEMSFEKHVEDSPRPSILVRIPKALLVRAENSIKLDRDECNSSEDLTISNKNKHFSTLTDNTNIKNVETEFVNTDTTENNDLDALKDNTTTKNVETESINVDAENNDSTTFNDNTITKNRAKTETVNNDIKNNDLKALHDDRAVKNAETELVNVYKEKNDSNPVSEGTTIKNFKIEPADINTKCCISNVSVKFRRKARSKFEIPDELRRRSRRIIHLRFQKECQQDSSLDVPSNVVNKSIMKESKGTGCDINQIVLGTFVKKSQKRTVVSNAVVECKKRRRGRPSKSDLERNLHLKEDPNLKAEPLSNSTVVECKKRKYTRRGWASKLDLEEEPCSVTTESGLVNNHDEVLQTPESPVWTLVPRSLFQCNFFKSQVLQVHPIQPQEQSRFLAPVNIPPPRTIFPARNFSNTRIRIKYPRSFLNTVPATRPKLPVDSSTKRPTVIYFRKNNKTYVTNQAAATSLQSELNKKTEINNDLLYLFKKYGMLNSTVIKNCYELAWHNISETESLLSDLFSSNPDSTFDLRTENVCVKQGTSTNNNYVCDVRSTEPMPNHSGITDTPASPSFFIEDIDTLCRGAIVESLKILFDEDAVLQ